MGVKKPLRWAVLSVSASASASGALASGSGGLIGGRSLGSYRWQNCSSSGSTSGCLGTYTTQPNPSSLITRVISYQAVCRWTISGRVSVNKNSVLPRFHRWCLRGLLPGCGSALPGRSRHSQPVLPGVGRTAAVTRGRSHVSRRHGSLQCHTTLA